MFKFVFYHTAWPLNANRLVHLMISQRQTDSLLVLEKLAVLDKERRYIISCSYVSLSKEWTGVTLMVYNFLHVFWLQPNFHIRYLFTSIFDCLPNTKYYMTHLTYFLSPNFHCKTVWLALLIPFCSWRKW